MYVFIYSRVIYTEYVSDVYIYILELYYFCKSQKKFPRKHKLIFDKIINTSIKISSS